MLEINDLVNPQDMTRMFVNPGSLKALYDQLSCVQGTTVRIGGYRINVIINENMPSNKVYFGGKVFTLCE